MLTFRLSKSSENLEVPQNQFIVRVLDIPVVTQRWVRTTQTVQKIVGACWCVDKAMDSLGYGFTAMFSYSALSWHAHASV